MKISFCFFLTHEVFYPSVSPIFWSAFVLSSADAFDLGHVQIFVRSLKGLRHVLDCMLISFETDSKYDKMIHFGKFTW